MKLTHGMVVAALFAGLLFASGNTALGQDDNPWGTGGGDSGTGTADSGSGSGSSSSGSASGDSGSGSSSSGSSNSGSSSSDMGTGSGDSASSGSNSSSGDSGFSSGSSSRKTTREEDVTAVPVGKFGLGIRSFDFAGTTGIGAGPEFRYWLDPGFGLQGALGFGIRSVDGANTEVTFAISAGTMLNLLGEDASPVYLQFGQRISFGFVGNPGGGTGDSSGLLFEFPLMLEYFITPQFSIHVEFGVQIHIITSGTGVFAGSAGFASTGKGFALGIGRNGTLLGIAGFTFYF